MESDPNYNSEIAAWLQGLAPGWRVIDDVCRPEDRDALIDAVKAYIDNNGYDVYFDSTYKKLKKIEIPEFLTNTTENELV